MRRRAAFPKPKPRVGGKPLYFDMGALIDEDYRYSLWRRWDASLPTLVFLMLNPSKADGRQDDPTIRRVVGYARRWGYGAVEVINLFAFRSTLPGNLVYEADPIGPDNDNYILAACLRAKKEGSEVVAAWGTFPQFKRGSLHARRDRYVERMLAREGITLTCLGVTKDGFPKHPVRLAYDVPKSSYWGFDHGRG